MLTKDDFRQELQVQLAAAQALGAVAITIRAGALHKKLGGYPGPSHRMPVCCQAMYEEQGINDTIASRPPKGKGASLEICYRLPR